MRGLTMFRATKRASIPGPPPAEMRGRAAEISDPGLLGWEVLWEALKTEPPSDDAFTLTYELGLDHEREIASGYGPHGATEFSGIRHGRRATLRMGMFPRIRHKAYNEVHVEASVVPFRLGVLDGRPAIDAGASRELEHVLEGLEPAPDVWRGLVVEGGPSGIMASRPVTAHAQGYLYDLWLIERLADQLDMRR
jgi:hypothetical protein